MHSGNRNPNLKVARSTTLKNRQNDQKLREKKPLVFYRLHKIFNLPSDKYYHLIMHKMQIEVKTSRIPMDDPRNSFW